MVVMEAFMLGALVAGLSVLDIYIIKTLCGRRSTNDGDEEERGLVLYPIRSGYGYPR